MARINLLPWREELRRERQRQFMLSTMMTALLGIILVFMIGLVFDQRIGHQQERNDRLQNEISKLQARIVQIEELERTRERLLSRKRVIEELQASRSLTVELLDKLAKSIPVGVTLQSVSQQGSDLRLQGWSQSNARVSAYLQSLDANDLFLLPDLNVVRASDRPVNPIEPYEFTIEVKLRPAIRDEEDEFGAYPVEGGAG
ncbi:MAG: fimbrial protein [Xanthomonadales bacterium]|nr:PilN domain-containing protein [Xanthomonadales bacterium]NIX11603.1 fimbrial protein [Xanthomonadales bacterium]